LEAEGQTATACLIRSIWLKGVMVLGGVALVLARLG
jgi:hypothetical protein